MVYNKKIIIAAFDFDGTITSKDTLFDFIRFYYGDFKFIVGLIILSPILTLYILKIIGNDRAKEILFTYYFKDQKYTNFKKKCQKYALRINQILHKDSMNRLEYHKKNKDRIFIVSASIHEWIAPWALENGIDMVIATKIDVRDNKITGKFKTKNCYGKEKVNRLKAIIDNRDNFIIYAYGDSNGDKELLAYSDKPTLYKR